MSNFSNKAFSTELKQKLHLSCFEHFEIIKKPLPLNRQSRLKLILGHQSARVLQRLTLIKYNKVSIYTTFPFEVAEDPALLIGPSSLLWISMCSSGACEAWFTASRQSIKYIIKQYYQNKKRNEESNCLDCI